MALIEKLNAIGDAIRAKTGGSDKLTLEQMPTEIASITTGGGGGPTVPEERLILTGDCSNYFGDGRWGWFIEEYGNQIQTSGINNANAMFRGCSMTSIPFEINFGVIGNNYDMGSMFMNCSQLKQIPICNNVAPSKLSSLFYGCSELEQLEFERMFNEYDHAYGNCAYMFYNCYKLRTIPADFFGLHYITSALSSASMSIFYYACMNCYNLEELVNIPFIYIRADSGITVNVFTSFLKNCYRLKKFTFQTYTSEVKAKSLTLDLSAYVGYAPSSIPDEALNVFSEDKRVTDDVTYQTLKDDPDWWTTDITYSRYNHDSAVETINSLFDTSTYITNNGGTNTIKFKGTAGSATDGGAINTLTAAEIAVATTKGWTVSLV